MSSCEGATAKVASPGVTASTNPKQVGGRPRQRQGRRVTVIHRIRPKLKDYAWIIDGSDIVLSSDTGVQMTLTDSDGRVLTLLENLDGTRTVGELVETLSHSLHISREDVAAAISALDEAGLLEGAATNTTMTGWEQERYFSTLAFFATFASLSTSRHSFQMKLRRSHVVLLGAGGLGSTLLFNLAGLSGGRVTALDADNVEV